MGAAGYQNASKSPSFTIEPFMRLGISALLLTSDAGYRKAGICRYIYQVIDKILELERNHTYVLFIPHDTELPKHWTARQNVEVVRVPFQGRIKRIVWEHWKVKSLVKAHRLDAWFSTAQSIPFPCGCPRSVMIHDLIPIFFPQYFTREKAIYQKMACRYAMKHAELIFANSETTKNDMIDYMGMPEMASRMVVTPLGPGNELHRLTVGPETQAVLDRLGVTFKRYFFGLGTLEPRKNLPALFDAFAILEKEGLPDDVGLVIGGGKGWMDGPIGEKLRASGIEHRVHFPGYIDDADLPALFAASEAFVFPSLYEGFGMPVLEAMLMGVPVIAADRAAMREVGGEVAQFFDPENPTEIATTLREFLAQDPSSRSERIEMGLERSKAFTWERCATLTIDAIEKLL